MPLCHRLRASDVAQSLSTAAGPLAAWLSGLPPEKSHSQFKCGLRTEHCEEWPGRQLGGLQAMADPRVPVVAWPCSQAWPPATVAPPLHVASALLPTGNFSLQLSLFALPATAKNLNPMDC